MMKLFDRLQKLVEAALAIMLAVMMCVVFVQTFTRYIVFHSIPWSEELSRFLFVGIIVLGINLGISRNQMVRIDILDVAESIAIARVELQKIWPNETKTFTDYHELIKIDGEWKIIGKVFAQHK